MKYVYDDGGREAAGYKGNAGDCVCRAIAITSGLPYKQVYEALANGNALQSVTKSCAAAGKRTARSGINTNRKWFKDYMRQIGFEWVACMGIGTGCRVHLRADELPTGRIIARVTGHYAAVIDGVLHDTHDCSRNGKRCVYGYWRLI